MKAWEIRDSTLALHEVDPPRPQVDAETIRITHAGICGSDLPKLLRPADFALPAPWRPGHEIVGIDTGGHPVAVDPLMPCQLCLRCHAGDTHLCPDLQRIGWDLPGGFAEQVSVPTRNLHALDSGLDPLYAVLADPAAVAIHGLRCNPLTPGRLAIIGAGTVGLLTAIHAHGTGWTVTVVHRDGHPPDHAFQRGIPVAFTSMSTIADTTFDAVVDAATGHAAAPLALALRLIRDGGTIIVQNAYHPDVTLPAPLRHIFRRSINLIGTFSFCRRHRADDFTAALDLLHTHSREIGYLVADAGRLADLPAALSRRPLHPGRRLVLSAR